MAEGQHLVRDMGQQPQEWGLLRPLQFLPRWGMLGLGVPLDLMCPGQGASTSQVPGKWGGVDWGGQAVFSTVNRWCLSPGCVGPGSGLSLVL